MGIFHSIFVFTSSLHQISLRLILILSYREALEDADGTTYTVLIESANPAELPDVGGVDSDRETYGLTEDIQAQLKNIHGTIRAYTWYVIGAFKNLAGAEVEEINLKFGMKIGGKAGLPIFTEGTAESNFEVSVKCKFPSVSPSAR
ncbi:CU044_2847 family protein [Leptolyngbya sp. BC1307]|uniref:CU044_2847 family protein n=1 Tax=Leptolyngbya sp. BC1307 TaxID=2029589 RepID=UPI00197FEB33|nr:CU044_2847 family protein [Leptolyngbya sp. BC1307]